MAEAEPINQSGYQILLSQNVSPGRAKAALTRFPDDLEAAKSWLNSGGYESEEGAQLHGRLRTESKFDPDLVTKLSSCDADAMWLNLNSEDSEREDPFVKLSTSEESEEVRKLAEEGFQMCEGNLDKQSPSSFKGWQKRWFYLWEDKLVYYKPGSPVQKGVISLKNIRDITTPNNTNRIDIVVSNEGKDRTYQLRAEDATSVKKWVTMIKANKARATKVGTTPIPPPVDEKIPLKKLHFKAHTGDVLLFCSQNTGGYIVQGVTGGEYDHIGILIRHAKNQVCVLEALGRHGVQLYKWEDFIKEKWYSQYKSMALRKLHIPNKKLRKDVVINIVNFVKEVVNCEYSWTPLKMMRRQSTNDMALKDRSYFCSELVAKAYKLSGILRDNCSSGSYTPAMFEEKFDLHLLKGARLLKEQAIDMNDG